MPELRLNIDDTFDNTLKEMIKTNDDAKTKADVVQRAVATYRYLRTLPKGQRIQVVDAQGNTVEENLLIP